MSTRACLILFLAFGFVLPGCKPDEKDRSRELLALFALSGVPRDLQIEHSYQVNTELLDRVGEFFHRSATFPKVQEFTSVQSVRLRSSLWTSDQRVRDYNQFILDAKSGAIVYSFGPRRLKAFLLPSLIGATDLAVLESGSLAIIDSASNLNLCFRFNGTIIEELPSCAALPGSYTKIAEGVGNEFVGVRNGIPVRVDAVNGSIQTIALDAVPANIDDLRMQERMFYALHDQGRSITAYESDGEAFRIVAFSNGLRIPLGDGDLSSVIPTFAISSVARDRVLALSRTHNCVLILNEKLEPISFLRFPSLPRPMRRLEDVRGISSVAGEMTFTVYTPGAFSVFSAVPGDDVDPLRYVPPELVSVVDILQNITSESFEPGEDLLTRPEIADALSAARANLTLEPAQ